MNVQPRGRAAWVSLICRVAAAACFIAGLAIRHQVGLALVGIAAVLLLVAFAWRRKAAPASEVVHSQSADLVGDDGKQLPGQLSITPTELVWVPDDYSRRRGATELRAPLSKPSDVSIQAGTALMDLVIRVQPETAAGFRLLTRRSRRLQRALGKAFA